MLKTTSRRQRIRWAFLVFLVLSLPFSALSVVNYIRIEAGVFNDGARALIERSRHIREQAKPAYESETLVALPPNPLNGPFYRFDDRFAEASVLAEPSRPEDSGMFDVVFSFEFNEGEDSGLAAAEGRSNLKLQEGMLVVKHDELDYLTNAQPVQIPKDDVGEIVIRARAEKGKHIRLAWSREPTPANPWKHKLDTPIVADNSFHTYIIEAKNALKRGVATGDSIRSLFIRPSNISDDHVEIDFIRFVSKRSKYIRAPRGITYETIGKELRRVLYMLPKQTLQYTLTVPKRSPTLDFGCGVLIDDRPIDFKIAIADGSQEVTLHDERIASESKWHDARLDLSRWAGREVRLSLTVSGSAENVAFWSNPVVSSVPNKPFNVVIILEDALRADHLSTYGYKLLTSPFKDRFAKQHAIVFRSAISQAEKTRPSIPTIMTSLMPTTTGVWHFADQLAEEYLTLAEIMRAQGFITASFIQNGNAGPYAGLHQGFSTLLDEEMTGETTEEILLGEPLMAWLERNRHRNFFLYVHVADPHGIYNPPSPYDAWYREIAPGKTPENFDGKLDPEWVKKPTLEGRRLLYDGEIRHNDAMIAGFIEELKSLGLYDNTLLVLTSDHGEHLGEHGEWEHHPPGFLQVTHVPLMLAYPARFPKSKQIAEMAQLIDIMPTVLELAQVDTKGLLLQGDSLVDLIEGRRLEDWRNRIVVSEEATVMDKARPSRNTGLRVFGSLFYRDWHLIASRRFWPQRGYIPESLRLKVFDFSRDREEEDPLYSFFADPYLRYRYTYILNKLQENNIAAWKNWTNNGQAQSHNYDPDVLEHLKALGYIE